MRNVALVLVGILTFAGSLAACAPVETGPSEITGKTNTDSYDYVKSIWVTTIDSRQIPCVMWSNTYRSASGVSCDWSGR